MKNLKEFFQKITQSPKILVLVGIFLFFFIIVLIILFSGKPTEKDATSITPTPTPVVGIITMEEPVPTPTLKIVWTTQDLNVPETMDIFSIKNPLINQKTGDLLAQKLGFESSNEQESISENLRIWSKGSASIILNFEDNLLQYSAGTLPQLAVQNVTDDTYFVTARNYSQNVFGIGTAQGLINHSVTYLDEHDAPISSDKAVVIRVSFYQSVNVLPVATISQSGAVFTLYLDKKLSLLSMSVKNAYSELSSLGKFKTTPLVDLISNSDSMALRINASSNQDISSEMVSSKTITFNQASAQTAYLSKENQLIPVYLLSGTVRAGIVQNQPGLYILPIILPQ